MARRWETQPLTREELADIFDQLDEELAEVAVDNAIRHLEVLR